MISFTEQEQKKLAILDKLFTALSAEDIQELAGCDLIVGRLKGNDLSGTGKLTQLFNEFTFLQNQVITIQADSYSLKTDFQSLLRCLNKGMGDSSVTSEFYNLKSKHNIY